MKIILSGLKITGITAAVPENYLDKQDLYAVFGEKEVNRIMASTGIEKLCIAPKEMTLSALCIAAAKKLFKELDVNPAKINAVILVSQTADYRLPPTSCILQDKLGLPESALAFDINYGCSGYIYGLYQAALLIASNSCQKVLLCTGDLISRHLDPKDQKTRLVLGDGASATLIEKGKDNWAFSLHTQGKNYQHLIIQNNSSANKNIKSYLTMDGSAIMAFVLEKIPALIKEVLKYSGWSKNYVDYFVFHQANAFILHYFRKKLIIPIDKMPIAVKEYGNTSSASIPITLCHYAEILKNKQKTRIIMTGFGVGLSWGAAALSLKDTCLSAIIRV